MSELAPTRADFLLSIPHLDGCSAMDAAYYGSWKSPWQFVKVITFRDEVKARDRRWIRVKCKGNNCLATAILKEDAVLYLKD